MRCADDQIIHAHRRGKIENGGRGVFAHGIHWNHANIALRAQLHHERHDRLRFGIVLPFGATESRGAIVDGDLFDKEHA